RAGLEPVVVGRDVTRVVEVADDVEVIAVRRVDDLAPHLRQRRDDAVGVGGGGQHPELRAQPLPLVRGQRGERGGRGRTGAAAQQQVERVRGGAVWPPRRAQLAAQGGGLGARD